MSAPRVRCNAAIDAARTMHPSLPLIVEVETLAAAREALRDGMRPHPDRRLRRRRRGAKRCASPPPRRSTAGSRWRSPAASTCGTVRAIAEDGVDCISIGGLTKHVHAIDLSMKLGPPRPGLGTPSRRGRIRTTANRPPTASAVSQRPPRSTPTPTAASAPLGAAAARRARRPRSAHLARRHDPEAQRVEAEFVAVLGPDALARACR